MSNMLIYTKNLKLAFKVEALVADIGVNVKSVSDEESALKWLDVRNFDAMFIDNSVTIETQQRLGGILWGKRLNAPFFVMEFEDENVTSEMKLFGAEIINENNLQKKIVKILERYFQNLPQSKNDFKVLVVDDLSSPREIICLYLEQLGLNIKTSEASSAKEALDMLSVKDQAFSCIITDMKMPHISGKELIRIVRETESIKQLPIIVLTAFGTIECLLDCLKAGASGFLVKPPKRTDLIREIGRAKRIIAQCTDPRLVTEDETMITKEFLESKGFV